MAFTRDEMTAYEAQPQKMVEIQNPFTESPSPVVASKTTETTSTATTTPVETVDTSQETSSVTEGTDPTASGDGTSGEETAATPAANADPEGEVETPAVEVPRKGSAQERIQELVDERNALRTYGNHMSTAVKTLTEEIERLKKGATPAATETTAQAPAAPAEADDPAPTMGDADVGFDVTKFAKKNAEWTQRQITKGVKQGVAQAVTEITTQQTAQQSKQAFEARVAAFEETHKDFKTVIGNPALPRLSDGAAKILATTEEGVSLLYYLGKNVDVATRISKMSEAQQLVRLGEIKADLKKAAVTSSATPPTAPVAGTRQAKPKSLTQAPPPPTPTPAGSRSQERSITDPSLSMDEFVKMERERKIAERQAKRAARGLR